MNKHLVVEIESEYGPPRREKVWFTSNAIPMASGAQYILGSYITRGNNGTIFTCYNERREEKVVKFMHRLDRQRLARFDFETQVLSDMDHAGIMPCHDVGAVQTTGQSEVPLLVTDRYVGNLEDHIRLGGCLPYSRVRSYALQLCDAFDHVHARTIVHRDIKPANFFLKDDKIITGDFGLATTSDDQGIDRYYRKEITLSGEMVGPIHWMSPELLDYSKDDKTPVDHRSDLFQLGLVIWYMGTGHIPRGILEVEDDPTGGKLYAIVSKAIKQSASRRYQSAAEMRNAVLEQGE